MKITLKSSVRRTYWTYEIDIDLQLVLVAPARYEIVIIFKDNEFEKIICPFLTPYTRNEIAALADISQEITRIATQLSNEG
tara:strand:+ start:4614 stop:4856 length:243 start_codon:yes stop_codon:yes gene_type:complete